MKRFKTRSLGRAGCIALALILAPVQVLANKVALIIGNSAYEHTSPLKNPRNDAEAMASKFRTLGFETIEGYDLTATEMAQMTREFARSVTGTEISVVFYAGHAIQVDGENYLIPVDARMDDELSIDFEAFPISMITRQLSRTDGANLLILDACRDNPFEQLTLGSSRSIGGGGLGKMDVRDNGTGTGIVFATAPGTVALDGEGDHSPFTEALLKHIGTPNTPITTVISNVTGEVYNATGEKQRPWFNQSYTAPVELYKTAALPAPDVSAGATAPATAPADGAAALEEEKYMFELARGSGYIEDYQAYLDFYPNGRYARFARIAIERLKTEAAEEESVKVAVARPETTKDVESRSVALPAYDPTTPLILSVTQQMLLAPANQTTEQALNMDRSTRRALQARLNATGNNVGRPDGSFGPKTRAGIAAWQASVGLPQTQFLNSMQFDLLVSQTEATYASFLNVPAASSGSGSKRKTSSGNNNIGNNIVKGISEGFGRAFGDKVFGN